jgi:hypothetical protein
VVLVHWNAYVRSSLENCISAELHRLREETPGMIIDERREREREYEEEAGWKRERKG